MRKTLQRDPENKMIGGVCGGLGNYFDLDPLLFRAIFLLVLFLAGGGLILYIILWIIMPEGPKGRSNSTYEETKEPAPDSKNTGSSPENVNISMGLVLLSAGILLLVNNLVPGFNFKKIWPVILIIVGGGLILGHKKFNSNKVSSNETSHEEPQ